MSQVEGYQSVPYVGLVVAAISVRLYGTSKGRRFGGRGDGVEKGFGLGLGLGEVKREGEEKKVNEGCEWRWRWRFLRGEFLTRLSKSLLRHGQMYYW